MGRVDLNVASKEEEVVKPLAKGRELVAKEDLRLDVED